MRHTGNPRAVMPRGCGMAEPGGWRWLMGSPARWRIMQELPMPTPLADEMTGVVTRGASAPPTSPDAGPCSAGRSTSNFPPKRSTVCFGSLPKARLAGARLLRLRQPAEGSPSTPSPYSRSSTLMRIKVDVGDGAVLLGPHQHAVVDGDILDVDG